MQLDFPACNAAEYLHPLKIGEVAVSPPLVLAPMAGLTDRAFRRVVRRCGGVGLVVTELASSEGLARRAARARDIVTIGPEEHPIAMQISGGDPERMACAGRLCAEAGADIVDINMGCPAPKVTKSACGAALLRDPGRAEAVARAVAKAVGVPVTAKLRLGWSDGSKNYVEVALRLVDAGVAALTLHSRTREQGYSGQADWKEIAILKGAVPVPVIGNGDVGTAEEALEMFRVTGCDAVMIGRAAVKNPWVFRQAADLDLAGRYAEPPLAARFDLIREHFADLLLEPPQASLHRMKTFLGKYTKGIPGASSFRAGLDRFRAPGPLLQAFEAWAEKELLKG